MEQSWLFLREQRNRTFASSAQLTLGQIIEKLEKCGLTHGEKNEPKQVEYDFGTAIPTTLGSWRGSYSELALGYKLSGYDNNDGHFAQTTAETFLSELKSAIGKKFTGWKGGEFTMNKDTPVWVANAGNSGNTGIINVVDDGWRIILMTAYCEY
jgi:hypothetical protein